MTSHTSLQTLAARAGSDIEAGEARPLNPSINQSTVHVHPDLATSQQILDHEIDGFTYYRFAHHNGTVLEHALAALEHAEIAVTCASGMAAITAAILTTTHHEQHIIVDTNAYGGTRSLAETDLTRYGIDVSFVNLCDLEALRTARRDTTTLVIAEAASNPTLRIPDIDAIAAVLNHTALLMVDATFVSPALLRPLEHGADLVVHSIPKYLGGHSVALGGSIAGSNELIEPIRGHIVRHGSTLGPFDAWLAHLGLKTLPLRMAAHTTNARLVSRALEEHHAVKLVHHPNLPSHPDHRTAQRIYPNGTGGMLAFDLHGDLDTVSDFINALQPNIPLAPSLGDVSTTISHPATSSHRNIERAVRHELGITDTLLRLSVGIEHHDDIIDDLYTALGTIPTGR